MSEFLPIRRNSDVFLMDRAIVFGINLSYMGAYRFGKRKLYAAVGAYIFGRRKLYAAIGAYRFGK